MKIIVLGAGTFGTAIANELLSNTHNEVFLFSSNLLKVTEINKDNTNKSCFPNRRLNERIKATSDRKIFESADIVFIALPSSIIKKRILELKDSFSNKTLFVNLSKGIFEEGLIIVDWLVDFLETDNIVTLKGPSFALEIINHTDTLLTLGYNKKDQLVIINTVFEGTCITLDYTRDIRGVELLSVLKNIYALLMGVIDARYNSANTRFMFLTKVFSEIRILLSELGGEKDTLFLSCGFGDICLTSLNDLSRNRTLGLLIGKGFFRQQEDQSLVILEGLDSICVIRNLTSSSNGLNLPLISKLYEFIDSDEKIINISFDNLF